MRVRRRKLLPAIVLFGFALAATATADDVSEALWQAARKGDRGAVEDLLDKGANVNAKNEIGVTALWIVAGKGDTALVELLLRAGADVNARDGIWYQTPLANAASKGHAELVTRLIGAGAKDIDAVLIATAGRGNLGVLNAILESGPRRQDALNAALVAAPRDNKDVQQALSKAGALPLEPVADEVRESWKPLAGVYENENGMKLTVEPLEFGVLARRSSGFAHVLKPAGADTFSTLGLDAISYAFERKGDRATRLVLRMFTAEITFYRLESKSVARPAQELAEDEEPALGAPSNWPSFRGLFASGVADTQHPPITWDVQSGKNVRWKTPIPGLGHSCPIVWGDKVFVTTAVSRDPDPKVRTGNYGDVDSVDDPTEHRWHVLCLDRASGEILWSRTAWEGVPRNKRHLKGSQANCTPATDGKHLVVCFGSEGLYCFDFAGELLWRRELGVLDSGIKLEEEYEWGFGSSPIVFENLAILQCDVGKGSSLAAYRLDDGSPQWITPRDEISSWSTPTVWRNSQRIELVTNASQYARGYDPATGKELWRLAKKSEITIPTPILGPDLVYVASGNRPIQPIIAIRPGALGDISPEPNQAADPHIAWSRLRGGPYMTTPLLYGNYLYACGNNGILSCYDAMTGKEVYKERLDGESYTASPVAADGRLYFTSEQGRVQLVKAGPDFELLAANEMGDVCMATPAISSGALLVRTQRFLFALGSNHRDP